MPDHFVMFSNYIKTVQRIQDKAVRCEAYDGIMQYMLTDGREPEFENDAAAAAFEGIRYALDRSLKLSESGKKGGEASKKPSASQRKANGKPTASQGKASSNDIDTDIDTGAAGSTQGRPSPQ